MTLLEKGVTIETVRIDALNGENREKPFLSLNPAGQLPALKLDDGQVLAESVVIAEYLDELFPEPPLFGRNAEERAVTRMWIRRVTLKVAEPMEKGFHFGRGLARFEGRERCLPGTSEGFEALTRDGLEWFEQQMQGKAFLAGDRMTLADIVLFAFIDLGNRVGQPLDPTNRTLAAFMERMGDRPSATTSALLISKLD
jgi:glutathione S-transferase